MIRGNRNTELPSNMIFLDTETRPTPIGPDREKHTLWFGCALYYRTRVEKGKQTSVEEWITFTTAKQFWDWVESKARERSKLYMFAHNWNFDGSILFTATELRKRGYETLQYINEKPPFMLRVKNGRKFLCLIDTLNYFQMSLANLGESIGIPKLSFPDYEQPYETWVEYCKRDVQVLQRAILDYIDFIRSEDLGNFRPTIASQAFNAFRHRFMPHPIFIHNNQSALDLERDSYFGGRVECFQIGKVTGPLYYLDVNSLYPAMMLENEYPTGIVRYRKSPTRDELRANLKTHAVTARVLINTDEPVYPFHKNGRMMFPVGEFCVALSTPELEYALERGHIVQIYDMAVFARQNIFKDYVTHLYHSRRQYASKDNPAFAFMCKIMLNSLYGKFGQRSAKWVDIRPANDDDPLEWLEQGKEGTPVLSYRLRAGIVQRKEREDEGRESFPAIAAHVTAYGRMRLWSLIVKAGRENVFYCDTDSLIVNVDGYRRLQNDIDPTILGKLKLEYTAADATFNGPKDYRVGETVKIKGVRRDAEQLDESTFRQTQFRSWDWHLSNGEEGFIYVDKVEKHLLRIYGKGIVGENGNVTPYRFRIVDDMVTA